MTAHVDVVARAGPQELSVNRLATLVGDSRLPTDREFVHQLAMIWVDYQLLGHAAAQDDSLNSRRRWTRRCGAWRPTRAPRSGSIKSPRRGPAAPTRSGYASAYASGKVLVARHILLTHRRATRRRRLRIRCGARPWRFAPVTPANFATAAQKNSKDPGSARHGGDLGVFDHGQMVRAIRAGAARAQAWRDLAAGAHAVWLAPDLSADICGSAR